MDLSYQGESKYLSITINQSWKATCSASWITLKNAEGRNSSNITVTADANTSENSRSATLIISYGGKSSYVSITQKGVPTLQLSKRQVDFEASPNASQTVSVTCNRIWYASSDKDWVSVSPAYSEGSGYLTITATSNPTMDSRSATVTVRSEAGAETIDITQAAGEGIIEASLYKSDCSRDGDILLLQIKASDRREWTVLRSSNATWLHFDTNSNTSQIVSGTGDKYILLYADQSTDIYARSCQLTIMSGSYTKTITVTQNAAPMSLGWMLTKPFGFIDLYFNTASFETIYNTLANQFDLTVYNNAYYVEVYKNPSLSGISCCGLPLGLFRAGFAYFDNKPQYSYIFEIDKSYISDITPYVKAILNEFSAIGVKLTYRSYSDYYVYYAYYDNIHIDFYVKTFSDGYQLNIEFSYK